MVAYVLRRVLVTIPVLWLVSLIVFSIMRLLPGDPAVLMLQGEGGASPEQIAELRELLGLNDPLYVQYGRFIWDAIHGRLGRSTRFKCDASTIIAKAFPFTAELSVGALLVSILLGLPMGVLAAVKPDTWVDGLCMTVSLVGVSMPVFWLGLLLIFFFSFQLGVLPSTSSDMSIRSLILPAFALGSINAGLIARLVRSNLLEVLGRDFINTARAKGLVEWSVICRHALRNALIPTVTVLGLQFARMLTGAAVTETVFSRPGIGRLVVDAVVWKDYPLVQGAVLFAAVLFLVMNLFVDLLYAWLDPRIHYA